MKSEHWFAEFDEDTDGAVWEFDNAVDSLYVVTSVQCDLAWCDWVIAKCKQELERRKGILDELTAEAQELGLGY